MGRAILIAALLSLALMPRLAAGEDLHVILPRSPDDWKVVTKRGDVTYRIHMEAVRDYPDSAWAFEVDTVPQWGHEIGFRYDFTEHGIPIQPVEDAEFWKWFWYIKNRNTADFVSITLYDHLGHAVALATSPALYDYRALTLEFPDRYRLVHVSLRETYDFRRRIHAPFDTLVDVAGIDLGLHEPVDQKVLLGPISFGPAPVDSIPPSPRALRHRTEVSKFLCADLDRDGVIEVLTPWQAGGKLWRYGARSRRFIRDDRADALNRPESFNLMCAGDLDGDGDLDLVAADPDDETLRILRRRRYGWSEDTLHVPLPEPAAILTCMALADDDGDGRPDLFLGYHLIGSTTLGRVFRLPGGEGGRFGRPRDIPVTTGVSGWGVYEIDLADLDGDGALDLIAGAGGQGVYVYPGSGAGTYGPKRLIDRLYGAGFLRGIQLADVNGDGRLDVFIGLYNNSGLAGETGQNRLWLNEGRFRFRNVAGDAGLTGTRWTEDACFADIDDRAGPELVVLEDERVTAYDLSPLAGYDASGSEPVPRIRARILYDDSAVTASSRYVACQDLDGNGRVELILSRENGPLIVPLPDSGPVRSVEVGGLGPGGNGFGDLVRGAGAHPWALPVLSTQRLGPVPFLVAADEPVSLGLQADRRTPARLLRPGSREMIPPAGPQSWWDRLRWQGPTLLEYPLLAARIPAVRAASGIFLIAGLGALALRLRGRLGSSEEERWRVLLARVGFSSHAAWRTGLNHFVRAANQVQEETGEGGPLPESEQARLRELLPPELLRLLGEAVDTAATLDVEGARSARQALDELDRIHRGPVAAPDRLVEAGRTLMSSFGLMQRTLAGRFSCKPQPVFERVRRFRSRSGGSPRIEWGGGAPDLARRFPMGAGDLFACMDELIVNAGKKDPAPARIEVAVRARGEKVAVLEVHDDGPGLEAEGARGDREGTRTGIQRITDLLRPYGGRLELEDAEGGGVLARILVPRFDLD